MRRLALSVSFALVVGCAGAPEPVLVPPPPASSAPPVASAPPAPKGPLAERPKVEAPPPFTPPAPVVLAGPKGSKLWVFPRHNLPLVSMAVVSRLGSADDPADLPGLAHLTMDMADEGAGKLDALQFSAALDKLGASLGSTTSREDATLYLDVLGERFEPALALLADVVLAPRHTDKDFSRVVDLWKNDLKARGDDPQEVARMVTNAVVFGPKSPYGRPGDGTLDTAGKVKKADVVQFHRRVFHPSRLTFIVAGDVTAERAKALVDKAFAGLDDKAADAAAPRDAAPAWKAPRVVAVIKDKSPQVVMTVVRSAPTAKAKKRPLLSLLNVAIGGSFTSRLNQNLREDHGWTYGARSRFVGYQDAGLFLARAAIRADAISPALAETLKELDQMAASGPSAEELKKLKALTRAEAVDTYATLRAVVHSLATNAALGLPPDVDADDLKLQMAVGEDEMSRLAKAHVGSKEATILLVGPKAAIDAAVKDNGLPQPEVWTADGHP